MNYTQNEPWAKTLLSQGIYKLRFGRRPLGTLTLSPDESTITPTPMKTKKGKHSLLKKLEKQIKKDKKGKRLRKAAGLPLGPEADRVYQPSRGPEMRYRSDGSAEVVFGLPVKRTDDPEYPWKKMDLIGGNVNPRTDDKYTKARAAQKAAEKAAKKWTKRKDISKTSKKAAKKYCDMT